MRLMVEQSMLTITDHRRDSAGLTYVYPVISRRSGGLSIGINFNPNNACNWRCVYCQVPNLLRGTAPKTDLEVLEQELRGFLKDVLEGGFYRRFEVPPAQQTIRDIAISGNGEPTSSTQFDRAVELIIEVARDYGLLGQIKLVLITNGSLIRREAVQTGLRRWGRLDGEVWFKLDSATPAGIRRINGTHHTPSGVLRNLEAVAPLCHVWLQTCLFAFDGQPPAEEECQAYLDFLRLALRRAIRLRGVLLYGLARPSMQPEAPHLAALPAEWMEGYADDIRRLGLEAKLNL